MEQLVGLIGPGIMGRPMAVNLLQGGCRLWVYARRPETLETLAARGATVAHSPREVAAQAQVIFTVVSDTPDVEQVILGPGGVIEGARPGTVVVDMSTISPAATRRIAQRLAEVNVEMLDAPVSGGEQGAIDGTLSIMVGGRESVFQRVLPLFQLLGRNIVHVGDHGAGQVAKTCNQVVVAGTITAVAEAMLLAGTAGVDPARVRQALLGGFAGSRILDVHGKRMLERQFAPGFKARLHQKDMRIALETAHELGLGLPGAALTAQLINALVGSGRGELDSSALLTVLEALSGKGESAG